MIPQTEAIVTPLLLDHEGKRYFPYHDSLGILTIGVGRNLTNKGLSPDEVDLCFANDLKQALYDATKYLGFQAFTALSPHRQAALLDLAFNLGADRLSKFQGLRACLLRQDYPGAAMHLRGSKWARQVQPKRVLDLTTLMEFGHLPKN